jgi:hypothetical protein
MKPLHLFAPLRKQPGFPKVSPLMRVGDVDYRLILPDAVSNLLLLHFIESGVAYRRVDRYCDPFGIEQIHAHPTLLDDEYQGAPTFAVSFSADEDVMEDDDVVGFVALRLAVSPLAARQLYNRAIDRKSIDMALADFVIKRDAYFRECGGFELLRLRYYLDAEDRYQVMLDLEANEPPAALLKELGRGKIRFSAFAASPS